MNMIVTVKDDYDKEQGTDLPMFSRVGKTTVSMYIAFSQAAMNKHEEEEYMKANPLADVNEFRNRKKKVRAKADDGGLSTLQEQREKLMKNDETIIRNKRVEEKVKADEERKAKKDAAKQQAAKFDRRLNLNVNKACSANFKSQTRDHREKVLSKLDSMGNGAPEVGKYNPKHDSLRGHMPDTMMRLESGQAGKRNRNFFAQTDPNQFLICEKVLRTLEDEIQIQSPKVLSPKQAAILQQQQQLQKQMTAGSPSHDQSQKSPEQTHPGSAEPPILSQQTLQNQHTQQEPVAQDGGGSPTSGKNNSIFTSPQVKEKVKKKAWDLDNFGKLSYPNIAVSPRFHMVIDKPIENDTDSRKLFVQNNNSNQYLVRRGQYPDKVVQPRVSKVPDTSKFQGRKDFTMDDIMRRSMKQESGGKLSEQSLLFSQHYSGANRDARSAGSVTQLSARLRSTSYNFKSGMMSPRSSARQTVDSFTDKQLQLHQTSISWTESKNQINLNKMIERKPGEFFIGSFATQAMYDLPTSFGEQMYTIPHFHTNIDCNQS